MENNHHHHHIPSSPIHHHSHPPRTHGDHHPQNGSPSQPKEVKVNLAAPRPGPASSASQCSASPQAGPSTLPARSAWSPDATAMPPAVQLHEASATGPSIVVERDWEQCPPAWPDHGPSYDEPISHSHAGTPAVSHTVQMPSPAQLPVHPAPVSPGPEPSTAPLTTSEPLIRSATTVVPAGPSRPAQGPPPPPAALPPTRKRPRSHSLPNFSLSGKRPKHRHAPTDLAAPARSYEPKRKEPTRVEQIAQKVHEESRRRQLRLSSRLQVLTAGMTPPINLHTLHALDAGEILKHPQLRHDLLFDNLAFRPVNDAVRPPGYTEIFTAGKAPTVDARDGNIMSDMYWESVETEIATGCRCIRWVIPGAYEGQPCSADALRSRQRVTACECGGWRRHETEEQWWQSAKSDKYASRLPTLIRVLRDVLQSLMGSTTPCVNHFAHSYSRAALEAHEQGCPTVTHALVPELQAALDPDFLTVQVRRGCFGVGLFSLLGDAMKVHCAPVRDAMVDDMVATATGADAQPADVALALRKCFDCVEVMKLDIANHQVHAIRPYMAQSAVESEWTAFSNHLSSIRLSVLDSYTQTWIRAASQRVLLASVPAERIRLIGQPGSGPNNELVLRSFAEGWVQLVFADWTFSNTPTRSPSSPVTPIAATAWPPVVQRRALMQGAVSLATSVIAPVPLPESLKLDSRRLKNFHAEAVDIVILQIILEIFRGYLQLAVPTLPLIHVLDEVDNIRGMVIDLFDESFSSGEASFGATISNIAVSLAHRVVQLKRPSGTTVDQHLTAIEANEIDQLASSMERQLLSLLRPNFPHFQRAWKRLQDIATLMLTHTFLGYRFDPNSPFFALAHAVRPRQALASSSSYGLSSYDSSSSSSSDSDMDSDDSSTDGFTGSSPADARLFAAHQRALWAAVEDRVTRVAEFASVRADIREWISRMERIGRFNLEVFGKVYGLQGMVVGQPARRYDDDDHEDRSM